MLIALVASCRQATEPEPGPPPEIATVTVHYGRTHTLDLVPGEWLTHITDCPYERGTELRFEREGPRVFLSVDGGPRRLACVEMGYRADDKQKGMEALRQAIADGVSPLKIGCEGKDLDALPPVPASIKIALHVTDEPLGSLGGFIGRCPGLYALHVGGYKIAPKSWALRRAKGLTSFSIFAPYEPETGSFLDDLTPLTEMTKLRVLSIWCGRRPADLRPLAGLTELRSLDLGGWGDRDSTMTLEPLRGLTKLRKLNLYASDPAADLGPLAGMTELVKLYLEVGPNVEDTQPLGNLTSLTGLTLKFWGDSKASDLSALGRLTKLQELDLWGPAKPDLGFLAHLGELRTLQLHWHDDLSSIPQGSRLDKLGSVRIRYSKNLSDVTALGALAAIEELARISHHFSVAAISWAGRRCKGCLGGAVPG